MEDYSFWILMANKKLKELYNATLEKDWELAQEKAKEAMTCLMDVVASLKK